MKPSPKAAQRHAAHTLISTPVEIPPICVSVDDAALLIGISDRFVQKLIDTGKLPSFKLGARRLIRVDALREWAADQEAATTQEREQVRALAAQHAPPFPLNRRRAG